MRNVWLFVLMLMLSGPHGLFAEDVVPVTSRIEAKNPWVGERIAFYVEVRAKGSFDGATSFSLPEVPQTVIVKVGSPIVSSQQEGDDTWFVQIHEFAVFTQAAGKLTIPTFAVRYGHHDGFVGPVHQESGEVPEASVEVQAPAGRKPGQFLITTDQLEIAETWQPEPGKIKQGDIVERTISQQAEEMTGMALSPPSLAAAEGVRVYPGQPSVADKFDRGELTGKRTDVIKYRFDQSGTMIIPESTYVWWDPEKKRFGTKQLPAVTFDVEAVAVPEEAEAVGPASRIWLYSLILVGAVIAIGVWQHRRLADWLRRCWKVWNPPQAVAARRLRSACRRNDVSLAEAAWSAWQNLQAADWSPSPQLQTAVDQMHRCRYARPPLENWNGAELLRAFQSQRKQRNKAEVTSPLPVMNPVR
ncbi:BatD family protein [Blastopirellula marina]|uniref:DUF7939 domain-containing protein n=1 Tax=Blastopirellula marina TaxID=124 RepID=A0A2S8G6Z4_9BACT|nr:BatD family protein [Blastopirellula marina]PQO40226.1 hypothetical protein C5Y98_06385 [Blastopirellula marina]PTL45593.1 hypothetical protein C5Y97_06385 [Blastopirellula marina]